MILCGDDIRGHRSGKSLIALHKNGIDENHRIINAPGAIPYIENIGEDSINRFQKQIIGHTITNEQFGKIIDSLFEYGCISIAAKNRLHEFRNILNPSHHHFTEMNPDDQRSTAAQIINFLYYDLASEGPC